MSKVNCNLKFILLKLDKEQKDLAIALNLSRNTISSFVNNKTYPRIIQVYDIVDIINAWAKEKNLQIEWSILDVWEKLLD